jgi:hypothetical protein
MEFYAAQENTDAIVTEKKTYIFSFDKRQTHLKEHLTK